MGEDVVETRWKHWETLPKHGEIPASQYRLSEECSPSFASVLDGENLAN